MHAPDLIGTNEHASVERWNRVPREIYGPAAEIRGERILRDGTWAPSDFDRSKYLWRHTAKTARVRDHASMFNTDGALIAGAALPYVFALPRAGIIRRIACYDYANQLFAGGQWGLATSGTAHRIRVQILDAAGAVTSTILTQTVPFDQRDWNQAVAALGTEQIGVLAVDGVGNQMDSILRVHFEFAMNFGTIPA